MGILIDSETRVLVQGITGNQGSFHTRLMLNYGTQIVAGTSPAKGGTSVHGIPVFETITEAQKEQVIDASIVFVPAPFAQDATVEALEAGIKTVVVITEHVPVHDAIDLMSFAKDKKATIVGPNTPGVITPGKSKVGILPAQVFVAGNVGIASRSGTLTYEIAAALSKMGVGQSTCIGIGGDPVVGLSFVDVLEMFRYDPETKAVVLIGEIGGNFEEDAAEYITKTRFPKPIVSYVAGCSAPAGKRMGHAGAIVMEKSGTAQSKIDAFEKAGVLVAEKPSDVARLAKQLLKTEK